MQGLSTHNSVCFNLRGVSPSCMATNTILRIESGDLVTTMALELEVQARCGAILSHRKHYQGRQYRWERTVPWANYGCIRQRTLKPFFDEGSAESDNDGGGAHFKEQRGRGRFEWGPKLGVRDGTETPKCAGGASRKPQCERATSSRRSLGPFGERRPVFRAVAWWALVASADCSILRCPLPRRAAVEKREKITTPRYSPQFGLTPRSLLHQYYTRMNIGQATRDEVPEAPIHRLPFDILHIIFLIRFEGGDQGGDTQWLPLVVSQVCRQWRTFAIEDQILWTHIHFYNQKWWSKLEWDSQKQWVSRSGDSPLEVMIEMQSRPGRRTIKTIKSILHVVRPHIHKFKKLTILCAHAKVLRILFNDLRVTPLPILEALEVKGSPIRQGWKGPVVLEASPQLRHIIYQNILVDYTSILFNTLRTVTLHDPRFNFFIGGLWYYWSNLVYHILARSPHLTHLKIGRTPYDFMDPTHLQRLPDFPTPTSVLIHQNIIEIWIEQTNIDFVEIILPWLRMPAFQAFKTGSRPTVCDWLFSLTALPVIIRHNPFPNLIEMSLLWDLWSSSPVDRLWEVLRLLPKVRFLALQRFHVSRQDFEGLAGICPALRHLRLHRCTELTHEMLEGMLRRRRENAQVAALEFLDIYFCSVRKDVGMMRVLDALEDVKVDIWE